MMAPAVSGDAARGASADGSSSGDPPDITDTRRKLGGEEESSEDVPDITNARRALRDGDKSSDDAPDIAVTRRALRESSDDVPDVSSEDIPAIADARRTLREGDESSEDIPDISDARALAAEIPARCLSNLIATANPAQQLRKDNYFLFTEAMSNGYFVANGMTGYSELPMKNKYGFVTLACQCERRGGREGCCQGNRARLDVRGIDEGENMSRELRAYISDVCRVTDDAIGENRFPEEDTGEFPGESPGSAPGGSPGGNVEIPTPVQSPPLDKPTMESPSPPAVVEDPAPTDRSTDSDSTGLSDGAWLGIALGIAVFLGLIIYMLYRRKRAKEARRESMKSDSEQSDKSKDLMAVEWPSQAADEGVMAEESGWAGSVTATDAVTDASQERSVMSEDASEDYSSAQTGTRGRSSERSYRGYKHEGYAHTD